VTVPPAEEGGLSSCLFHKTTAVCHIQAEFIRGCGIDGP